MQRHTYKPFDKFSGITNDQRHLGNHFTSFTRKARYEVVRIYYYAKQSPFCCYMF